MEMAAPFCLVVKGRIKIKIKIKIKSKKDTNVAIRMVPSP